MSGCIVREDPKSDPIVPILLSAIVHQVLLWPPRPQLAGWMSGSSSRSSLVVVYRLPRPIFRLVLFYSTWSVVVRLIFRVACTATEDHSTPVFTLRFHRNRAKTRKGEVALVVYHKL